MTEADEELADRLRSVDSAEFEELVAELWELDGWETRVSARGPGRGADVLAEQEGAITQTLALYVESRRPENEVEDAELRRLVAPEKRDVAADVVVVVTTSSFSEAATEWAGENDVKLVDWSDLVGMIREHDADEIVERYVSGSDPDTEGGAADAESGADDPGSAGTDEPSEAGIDDRSARRDVGDRIDFTGIVRLATLAGSAFQVIGLLLSAARLFALGVGIYFFAWLFTVLAAVGYGWMRWKEGTKSVLAVPTAFLITLFPVVGGVAYYLLSR